MQENIPEARGPAAGPSLSASSPPAGKPAEKDPSAGDPMVTTEAPAPNDMVHDDGLGDFGGVESVVPGVSPMHACVLYLASTFAARRHATTSSTPLAAPVDLLFGEVRSHGFGYDRGLRGVCMLVLRSFLPSFARRAWMPSISSTRLASPGWRLT